MKPMNDSASRVRSMREHLAHQYTREALSTETLQRFAESMHLPSTSQNLKNLAERKRTYAKTAAR